MNWTKAAAFDASEPLANSVNIPQTIEDVSRSMTNNIRTNGVKTFFNDSNAASNIINGTSWQSEVIVGVNYGKSICEQIQF